MSSGKYNRSFASDDSSYFVSMGPQVLDAPRLKEPSFECSLAILQLITYCPSRSHCFDCSAASVACTDSSC